ncbi:MAG: hypothetical protein ACYCXA_13600 [Actinomycetes bacterium]
MYAWIWHRLPGPWPVRTLLGLVLLLLVVVVLFTLVFPAVSGWLPIDRVTLTPTTGAG